MNKSRYYRATLSALIGYMEQFRDKIAHAVPSIWMSEQIFRMESAWNFQ